MLTNSVKWFNYNQSLVRRGEILLGFGVIDNLDAELKEMNEDKIGESFHYPDTFLLLLGYAKVFFHLLYRQTKEGIAQDDMSMEKHLQFLIILQ